MYKLTTKRDFAPVNYDDSPVPVDQYAAQDFNRGVNGLPANDLTLLERAQSLAEAQLVASRLQELKLNTDMSDLPDREIVARIRPTWCQTPAEIDRFLDYYYNNVVEPSLGARKLSDPVQDPVQAPAQYPVQAPAAE